MGTEIQKRKRRGLEEVTDCLIAVAMANGNCAKAARELEKLGTTINSGTLARWKNDLHADDYQRIRADLLPQLGAQLADQHVDLARQQIEHAAVLEQEMFEQREQMEPRDKVQYLGKLDIGSGIHTQRAQELQGDIATPAEETRSVEELLRSLASRGLPIIEVEATEIPPED